MDRKHFLRLMALGGLLPIVLPGCRKYGPIDPYRGSVIIIGAGAAGLYAAWLLKNAGATVQILEASDSIGGRIKELTGFADFPIELGAEEVHGQKTVWHDIVFDTDAKVVDSDDEDIFFINGVRQTEEDLADNADYKALKKLVEDIGDFKGDDMTMEAYVASKGIGGQFIPLANAILGNEFGTSNDRLGVLGVALDDALWTAGNKNFMLKNRSFLSILKEKFASVIPDVQLNRLVIEVDHTGDTVRVRDVTGAYHEADKVIVTTSVAVLKAGVIQFDPDLPYVKQQAMSKIGMAEGMKVILKFSSQFWPDDTGSIFGNGLIPEFWVTSGGGRSGSDHVITAFVNGQNAATLRVLGTGIPALICSELDQIFGGTVATGSLIDSHVEDWFANPFVGGTYSYPTVGMPASARRELAVPLGGKLFFAGEATHFEGHPSTVHGALESAYRAVEELVNA